VYERNVTKEMTTSYGLAYIPYVKFIQSEQSYNKNRDYLIVTKLTFMYNKIKKIINANF
jgi:hypothetical protein